MSHKLSNTESSGNILQGKVVRTQGTGHRDLWAVLVICILIPSSILIATLAPSSPQIQSGYTRSFSSPAYVLQTSDGGYIILGNKETIIVNSEAGSTYNENRLRSPPWIDTILIEKTDAYGNKQWSRTYGGGNGHNAQSVQQTSDGGYVILASLRTIHEENGPPSFYEDDIWLIKIDESGNVKWNRTYGGRGWEWPNSVLQTSDRGYIIAATTTSNGAGSSDFWLLKTDLNGNMEWNKTYGGTTVDAVSSFQKTSDGGYLIAGTSYPDALIISDRVFWLVKTDQKGIVQWNATYTLSEPKRLEFGRETSEGEYLMGGTIGTSTLSGTTTPIGWDLWLMKCDSNRSILWDKTYDLGQEESLYSLQLTTDGGYMLAGNTYSYGENNADIWLVKTDQGGNVEWNKTYGGSGEAYLHSFGKTSDNGYIMVASSSFGTEGLYLIKTDSLGSIEWAKTLELPS